MAQSLCSCSVSSEYPHVNSIQRKEVWGSSNGNRNRKAKTHHKVFTPQPSVRLVINGEIGSGSQSSWCQIRPEISDCQFMRLRD